MISQEDDRASVPHCLEEAEEETKTGITRCVPEEEEGLEVGAGAGAGEAAEICRGGRAGEKVAVSIPEPDHPGEMVKRKGLVASLVTK